MFDNLLERLSLTEEDYINAIKCSSNRTKILLERRPIDICTNNFSCHIPKDWNANKDSQYVLDSYATTTYCISYMKKLDKTMTMTFKHIREEYQKTNIDVVQTITRLGKTLLNLQQMLAQQVVYIVLSLPLNTSSRKCIFINTSPKDQRAFILKKPKDMQLEPDNSEDILCA
jgi:hypothetical protein